MGGPSEHPSRRNYVSLSPKGIILMNKRLYKKFGEPEAIVLLFEKRNNLIGLLRSREGVKEAFPVRSRDGYHFIHARPFCKNYGIVVPATERFVDPEIDPEGVMRLDLTKTVSAAHRRRSQ